MIALMKRSARTPHGTVLHAAVSLLALSLLAACGGTRDPGPPPVGVTSVTGKVVLPVGHEVDLGTLTVSTPLGMFPVSATGEFQADVFSGAATELDVETAEGTLLLLGLSDGSTATASLSSTAEALLYYLVGGLWLPPDAQAKVHALLPGTPEAATLESELARQLLAGGNGLANADAELEAALVAAHASLLGDAAMAPLAALAVQSRPLTTAGVDASDIIIDPTGQRSGVEVLHNPGGPGVVAQNAYRRPAAVLAYETSWEDADAVETPVDPPKFVERVEVPPTGQLEFFNALVDAVTGNAPFAPVLSPALRLPGHDGASRTHYRLVLVGPSLFDDPWPIMTDPLFTGLHDEWNDIALEKSLDLFMDQLLIPLVEVYGLGNLAKLDAAKLKSMRDRVRVIHDKHLMKLGVYLTQGQGAYAAGLKFVLEELATNKTYRIDMIEMIKDSLELSEKNKVSIDAMERRLSGRAGASAIAAAVQTALVSGDVAKIMYDLGSSARVIDWRVTMAPALFTLSPAVGTVTRHQASVKFTVQPKGNTSGNYLYRWSTSGDHGELNDLLQAGRSVDTSEAEVWYFHNSPSSITNQDRDTVAVEVFEVPVGTKTIPAGATPVARMAAEVRGSDHDIDGRLSIDYGVTPVGMWDEGRQLECAEMVLRFKAVPNASSYTVLASGVGGQGDERNPNQDFRRSSTASVFIDPNAKLEKTGEGWNIGQGYTADYYGVCEWRSITSPDTYASTPATLSARYDRANDEYVVYLFARQDTTAIAPDLPGWVTIGAQVPLWYEWVDGASFEVKVK